MARFGAVVATIRSIFTNTNFQVAAGIFMVAVIVALVAEIVGAQAKDIVTVATSIAGLSTVAVGLALAKDAFKLLYDKEAHQRAIRTGIDHEQTALASVVSSVASVTVPTVAVDLNTLLPALIKTAAGLAIAVLLFGVLLLTGASFSTQAGPATPGTSATRSPSTTQAAPTPAPSSPPSPASS